MKLEEAQAEARQRRAARRGATKRENDEFTDLGPEEFDIGDVPTPAGLSEDDEGEHRYLRAENRSASQASSSSDSRRPTLNFTQDDF